MYEYWMAKRIELTFHPVHLELEIQSTGPQDTATWPACGARDADTNQTFWQPATSIPGVRNQYSALACKKGFRMSSPRSTFKMSSDVSNTLLLK
jgi:hypothetical protein